MAVLDPIQLTISNFSELDLPTTLTIPDFPGESSDKNTHVISVANEIYIERDDFRLVGDKQYRRLTKEQPVGLKHVGIVLYYVSEDKKGIVVRAEKLTEQNKPKAFIHWVANPVEIETRLYERL